MADSIDLFDLDLVKDDPETFTMLMNAHVADLDTNYTFYTKEAEKTRAEAIENAGSSPSEETLQGIELTYRADCAEGMRQGFDDLAKTKYGITGLELQERVKAAGVQYEIREDWIPQPVVEQPEQQQERPPTYAADDTSTLANNERSKVLRTAFDDNRGDSTHHDSRLVYDGDRTEGEAGEVAGTPHTADSGNSTDHVDEDELQNSNDRGYEPEI